MLQKITIIGVGLIGGSLAKALKTQKFAQEIVGFGRNEEQLRLAKELAIIDNWTLDISEALTGSDIVVLATPVGSFREVLSTIKPHITTQILTDVGSTKQSVIRDVAEILGEVDFVPAHPIAGKEHTGCAHADEQLFADKKVIITAQEHTSSVQTIAEMWQHTGAIVEHMDANTHDDIFALTSHLPHLLAFGMIGYMADNKGSEKYTGGGFKDFSRIASSDSQMWADICENNSAEILKHLEGYQTELDNLRILIEHNDKEIYKQYFKRAKDNRNAWMDDNS